MFENCVENHFVPKLIVLCGNFTSRSISHGQGRDVQRYQGSRVFLPTSFLDLPWLENFDALADLIASYPMITRSTHFVFVPGPLDMTMNSTLPRRPLLSSFVGRLKAKIPKVHFATNPCRIKFFDQEIVIFRDDSMARMLRNIVGVKPDARSDDLKKFVRAASLNPFIASPRYIAGAIYSGPRASLPINDQHSGYSVRLRPFPPLISSTDGSECFSIHLDFTL
jgi:DNA polymerase epsilon subunit 2